MLKIKHLILEITLDGTGGGRFSSIHNTVYLDISLLEGCYWTLLPQVTFVLTYDDVVYHVDSLGIVAGGSGVEFWQSSGVGGTITAAGSAA